MTEIVRLWRQGQLPIKNGVYFADGRSYAIDVVRGGLSVGEQFDPSTSKVNPSNARTVPIAAILCKI
jgi:hypothetical protein